MQTFQLDEILDLIHRGQTFSGKISTSGCIIKLEEYLPVICLSLHSGHQLRPLLQSTCRLDEQSRRQLEAPLSNELIASQPITLSCDDSHFEYDLNQSESQCLDLSKHSSAPMWDKAYSQNQHHISQIKHHQFYQIYDALLAKLESMFDRVLIFELSMGKRVSLQDTPVYDCPVFEVNTGLVKLGRWKPLITYFETTLNAIELPNITTSTRLTPCQTRPAYLIAHTSRYFKRSLVLPINVQPIFINESGDEVYPLVLDYLKRGLKIAFSHTGAFHQRQYTSRQQTRSANMLSSNIDPTVLDVDARLYKLSQSFSTLKYVNPTNITSERKRFFSAPSRYQSQFRYRQLPIDANEFKRQLYRIELDKINDPALKQLYADMVNQLSDQVDLLTSVGQEHFVYNAIRFYGEPDDKAVSNAKFLLYAKALPTQSGNVLDAESAAEIMRKQAQRWGMKCKVSLSPSLLARAMVKSSPAQLVLNSHAHFSSAEIQRLNQHELGVHMATSLNAKRQPLKALQMGFPGATQTQEGLAILAEFSAGYMEHARLNMLACRVLAVSSMLKERNFYQTYSYLVDELAMDTDAAFTTTTRVYRGGGFTKDHLYLSGFLQMLSLSAEREVGNLLTGKTSAQYIDLIDELVARDWIKAPRFNIGINSFSSNAEDATLNYLIESLKV